MKESVGSTWLFGLAITFILLFTGFLSIAINYSRVFKVKNEVLSIMEKYEGYSATSRKIINQYLREAGYNNTGKCPVTGTGEYKYYPETSLDNDGSTMPDPTKNLDAYYCIRKNDQNGYDIMLFFKFDLPVLGDLGNISVAGKTRRISYNTYPIDLGNKV